MQTAMRKVLRRVKHFIRHRQVEADLAEELEFHRSMTETRIERSGVPALDAAYASRRILGNVTLAREDARDVWRWPSLESIWQDIRFGARTLAAHAGFTTIALITLALGIGANTTIFSVVEAVVLRPLPYHDPARLAVLWTDDTKRNVHEAPTSSLLASDWKNQSRTF